MNNFDIGRAIVQTSLALRGSTPLTQEQALAVLDKACAPWRDESAEFESQHPDNPDHVHPDYDNDTDPIAPFGMLLKEAFWPDIPSSEWASLHETWGLSDDDMTDVEHRLHHEWYVRVDFEFHKRYGLYGSDAGEPMPYIPPIRLRGIQQGE